MVFTYHVIKLNDTCVFLSVGISTRTCSSVCRKRPNKAPGESSTWWRWMPWRGIIISARKDWKRRGIRVFLSALLVLQQLFVSNLLLSYTCRSNGSNRSSRLWTVITLARKLPSKVQCFVSSLSPVMLLQKVSVIFALQYFLSGIFLAFLFWRRSGVVTLVHGRIRNAPRVNFPHSPSAKRSVLTRCVRISEVRKRFSSCDMGSSSFW